MKYRDIVWWIGFVAFVGYLFVFFWATITNELWNSMTSYFFLGGAVLIFFLEWIKDKPKEIKKIKYKNDI